MINRWYDQVPGLIGNVERVRYSSGLNAIGGPSAKKDGSIVGLKVILYQQIYLLKSLPVHHITTIVKWFTVFLIKQSSLLLVHYLLFLKLCYRQFHINNNKSNHLKKYSNNDPEKPRWLGNSTEIIFITIWYIKMSLF